MYHTILDAARTRLSGEYSKKDDVGHLAFYGTVENALEFFGVNKLSEIVMEINYEGGKGRGDEFIEKFEQTRRG